MKDNRQQNTAQGYSFIPYMRICLVV